MAKKKTTKKTTKKTSKKAPKKRRAKKSTAKPDRSEPLGPCSVCGENAYRTGPSTKRRGERVRYCNRHYHRVMRTGSVDLQRPTLTDAKVKWLRDQHFEKGRTVRELAEEVGMSYSALWVRLQLDYKFDD